MQRVIDQYFQALCKGNAKAAAQCFAPDATHRDPFDAPVNRGRDAICQFLEQVLELFAALHIAPEKIFYAGDHAAVQWKAKGRGKNGEEVAFEGVDVFRFNNQGQIAALEGYWLAGPVLEKLAA